MAKRLLATASGIRIYSRHSADCSHAADSSYLKCQCVKWAQYSFAGKQYKVTLKTRSISGAKAAALDLMQRLDSDETTGEVFAKLKRESVTISDAVKKWLAFREQSG